IRILLSLYFTFFFFQAEDGIRDRNVTGVQTCALPIFISFSNDPIARQHFGPYTQGFHKVEYDNLEALEAVFKKEGENIAGFLIRSEERRVGKECRYRWWRGS